MVIYTTIREGRRRELTEMVKQFSYNWPEAEDDDFDPKLIEKSKSMTIEQIDEDWESFVDNLNFR